MNAADRCPPPGHVEAMESIIRDWLADPETTIFCGYWPDGAIVELLPRGEVLLSGPRYDGVFSGLRELRLAQGAHHVHLDLGRLVRATYLVVPSVCYGFRPSFELRLTVAGDDPARRFGLGFSMTHPYAGDRLREATALRYFQRAADHLERYPDIASLAFRDGPVPEGRGTDWSAVESLIGRTPSLAAFRAHRIPAPAPTR